MFRGEACGVCGRGKTLSLSFLRCCSVGLGFHLPLQKAVGLLGEAPFTTGLFFTLVPVFVASAQLQRCIAVSAGSNGLLDCLNGYAEGFGPQLREPPVCCGHGRRHREGPQLRLP